MFFTFEAINVLAEFTHLTLFCTLQTMCLIANIKSIPTVDCLIITTLSFSFIVFQVLSYNNDIFTYLRCSSIEQNSSRAETTHLVDVGWLKIN